MTITEIMNNYQVNLTDIANRSGISKTTLSNAFNRPFETWTIRIQDGVARAVNETPEQILILLQGRKYQLNIDDKSQTIQGVQINDSRTYQAIKFTVINNAMEGWEPVSEDIQELVAFAQTDHPEIEERYKDIFGTDHDR